MQKKSSSWTQVGQTTAKNHQAPTISSIEKSLSRNRQIVWSLARPRAIKEESKAANRDWVDHQACSLLQYIECYSLSFIMRNYFNKLSWLRQKLGFGDTNLEKYKDKKLESSLLREDIGYKTWTMYKSHLAHEEHALCLLVRSNMWLQWQPKLRKYQKKTGSSRIWESM